MTLSFNNMANAMENIETNRRTMMASVSHDLRTPMTTIGGFVDGILDGTIRPEQQRQYLEIISEEVKRLTRMAACCPFPVWKTAMPCGKRPLI